MVITSKVAAAVELLTKMTDKPIQRKDLLDGSKISDSYTEQILLKLKSYGLVTTKRGKINSGYMLAKKHEDITVRDVILSLDGKLHNMEKNSKKVIRKRKSNIVAVAKIADHFVEGMFDTISIKHIIDCDFDQLREYRF